MTVGSRDDVMEQCCVVGDAHWISGNPPEDGATHQLRIRYNHEAAPARVRLLDSGRFRAEFDTPQFAITPGQACVVYDGNEVLGGGWIDGVSTKE